MRAKLVAENIEFQRNQETRKALKLGWIESNRDIDNLAKNLEKYLKDLGISRLVDIKRDIDLEVDWKDGSKHLIMWKLPKIRTNRQIIKDWIQKNTPYVYYQDWPVGERRNKGYAFQLLDKNSDWLKEHVEFQRGQDTKKALTLGRENLIQTEEGLAQIFAEDFKDLGPINVRAYEWKGEMDELTFDISEDIIKDIEDIIGYDENFNVWLEERMEDWVLKDTPYILNSFSRVQTAPTKTIDGINYYTYDIRFDN